MAKQFAYLAVYDDLRNEIIQGFYASGSKLPSKRMLSERFGVSVISVQHALDLLSDEGYIQPKERFGNYVIYQQQQVFPVERKVTAKQSIEREVLEFPFSSYARNMRSVLSEYGEQILERSPHLGCEELRVAIASYLLRSRGVRVLPSQIVIGAGSEYLYGLLLQLLGHDTIYAIEEPSYEQIEKVYRANRVPFRQLTLLKDGIDSQLLSATDASVLHITPYRSYPSGFSASASKKREYLDWVKQAGRMIIEDDFSSEFHPASKPTETLFSLDRLGRVIYLNTFSLTLAPGVRVGYMVLPENLLPLFAETVGFYSCTVPTFEQLVLASFLNSGEFERHLNRVRRKIRKAQQIKKEDLV